MNKIISADYERAVKYIDKTGSGVVYPLSIAEMVQSGDIFISKHSALFWHYSGFAFIYGDYNEHFLNSVYGMFLSDDCKIPRRFILFVTDEKVKEFLLTKDGFILEKRYFFEYHKNSFEKKSILPVGFKICEIDEDLLNRIKGNVNPLFSWNNSSEFLNYGKGYCIMEEENVVAWAFSAAISSDEIDIGIETRSEYRHMGLGAIVAEKMIQYILNQNKRPVWACNSINIPSQKLAEKLGFVKTSECFTIKRQH
ncbi:MAG: GNAT family N-acetyltransferase [Ruminococcus sp.]|nr:GNAT family N-acetyltransferase [Ruminococcus sp.]MDE6849639.1 GNAT family N-acetyltransferase [Ruminococcus sp.]